MKKPPEPPKKHAKEMTTEEAVNHLFHPDVVSHAKEHANKKLERPKKKV
jgi:hypothetical protein